jgi:putative hemolysin
MSQIIVECLIILLLIFANGILSMAEIATFSARKTKLKQKAQKGDRNAQVALDLANAPTRFLSTVQIGITLIGILTGVFGGATITQRLEEHLRLIPGLAAYAHIISLSFVVLVISYFSLLLGELVPKQLGLSNSEKIASSLAVPMRKLASIASPFVYCLSKSSDLVLGILHVRQRPEPVVTEEEIKMLIQEGTQNGVFEQAEQTMVERIFRMGDQRISAIMMPKTEIVCIGLHDSLEENCRKIIQSGHSHFPAYKDNRDQIVGVLHIKDVLNTALAKEPVDLPKLVRQSLYVPENMRVLKVLETFKKSAMHTALVVDEYGCMQGLVTTNDILEAIVGDIPTLDTLTPSHAMQREDGSWLLDGILPIHEFKEIFHLEHLAGEENANFQTLGGFVMTHMERIPAIADHFEHDGLRYEVVDMDGNRVDKILVTKANR